MLVAVKTVITDKVVIPLIILLSRLLPIKFEFNNIFCFDEAQHIAALLFFGFIR